MSNLAAGFLARAASAPERVALRLDGRAISYGDLAARALSLGGELAARLEDPESRVVILARRSVEAYVALMGVSAAGMAFVPVDPDLPLERCVEQIRRARPAAIIVDRRPDPALTALGMPILHPGVGGASANPLAGPRAVAADAAAYLMYTSGTTGVPKAVVVTVGNVAHFLGVMRERCPIYPEDRVSQFYDLTFDPSVLEIFPALEAGACLHVVPSPERLSPARFIRDEALTVWHSVPSVIGALRRFGQLAPGCFPSIRLSMFGGEALLLGHAEAWRAAAPNGAVDNQYGPTEVTVGCLAELVGERPRITAERGVIAIGEPFPGTRAAVVDGSGALVPDGAVGELALSGAQVSAGYFDDPALTQRRFPTVDIAGSGRARWYLTGDRARRDEDGHFHHLGRLDHQVKIQGKRVELEEIEAHVRDVTGGEAAVLPWPVREGAAVGVIAFVVGGRVAPEVAQIALRGRLPGHMVPRRILPREALPLGATGKIDRRALAAELQASADGALD